MKINSTAPTSSQLSQLSGVTTKPTHDDQKARETFDQFVGETFYSQMLKSLRKTQGKTPYFNGGRGEEVFRGQLDQTLAENMAKSDHGRFSSTMYDQLRLSAVKQPDTAAFPICTGKQAIRTH